MSVMNAWARPRDSNRTSCWFFLSFVGIKWELYDSMCHLVGRNVLNVQSPKGGTKVIRNSRKNSQEEVEVSHGVNWNGRAYVSYEETHQTYYNAICIASALIPFSLSRCLCSFNFHSGIFVHKSDSLILFGPKTSSKALFSFTFFSLSFHINLFTLPSELSHFEVRFCYAMNFPSFFRSSTRCHRLFCASVCVMTSRHCAKFVRLLRFLSNPVLLPVFVFSSVYPFMALYKYSTTILYSFRCEIYYCMWCWEKYTHFKSSAVYGH